MKCTACNERKGKTRCEECNTLFCLPCMNKHYDELAQQFQLLIDVRNEIKQSLDVSQSAFSNGKQVPCLIEIDEWEQKMIQRIHEVAAKVRTNVNELIMKHTNEISNRLEKISVYMQQRQKEGDYFENDIERINNQLNELKNGVKRINETIRLNSSLSNNIEWNTLIYVFEEELLSKATSELVENEDRDVEMKKKPILMKQSHETEKIDECSSMILLPEQSTTNTSGSSTIPVNILQSNISYNKPNQKSHLPRSCITCGGFFHVLLSTGICSECNQKRQVSTPTRSSSMRLEPLNWYGRTNDGHSATDLSSTATTGNSMTIYCPYCKHPHLLSVITSYSKYYCSMCRNLLSYTRLQ